MQLFDIFSPILADSTGPLLLAFGLLIIVSRDLIALKKSENVYFPKTVWFYLQFLLLAIIVLCQTMYTIALHSVVGNIFDIRIISALANILSAIVAGYVQYVQYFRTRVPSGVVLLYWFFSSVIGFVKLYGYIQQKKNSEHEVLFTSFCLVLLATVGELVTVCISKPRSEYESLNDEVDQSPEASANIFSRLTFFYLNNLMNLGYRSYLTEDDLPDLPRNTRTDRSREKFDIAWESERQATVPSLPRALVRSFGLTYLAGIFFKLTGDVLSFMQPNLLRQLLLFVNSYNSRTINETVSLSNGIIIALGMFVCSFLQTIMQQQYLTRCFSAGLNIKSSLTSRLYRKTIFLSNDSRQSKSTGEIINLMSVDVQRLQDISQSGQALWSGPFQIVLCLYSLHSLLGTSMWAGVGVTLCTISINAYITRKRRALQIVQMKVKDKRTRLVGEILASMKSIKLFAWEESFIRRVNAIRNDEELANLRTKALYNAASNFIGSSAPFLVSCTTFAFFIWSAGKPLTTDIVFPSLTLFNLLSSPLTQIPQTINKLIEAAVSVNRLRDFLLLAELQPDAVTHLDAATTSSQSAVTVINGTFLWDNKGLLKPAIKNISFDAKAGKLSCIIGRVGTGKSALLQAILGDLHREFGNVIVRGDVAYCSQVPWIMNATVKENILFGKRFHAGFYEKTVRACALIEDFAVLPDGDDTIVGEKGISLSGGQKARLSLARAVYSRADVYILDDPLSAVDQHVGRHIIDNVLGPDGLLASKTKIMATNAIPVLAQADSITMLRDGEIVDSGSYSEIMTRQDSEIYKLLNEFGTRREPDCRENVDKTDPLSANGGADDDDDDDFKGFGVALRRASTASFKKPTMDVPNRRSKQGKENSEKGRVKFQVYKEYIKAANVFAVGSFIILVVAAQSMAVGGNVWLKHWSDVNTQYGGNPDTGKYLGTYLIFGVTGACFTLLYTLVLFIFCTIQAAKKLHDRMLRSVIRAPMSFFDTTPLGRIINRFTSDINRVDEALARVFTSFFTNTCKVIFSVAVVSTANPTFILLVVPISFVYVYYQKFYLRTSRELKRLESVSRSPIIAHFQESLHGVSTVRAYSQVRRFNRLNEYHIDFNNKAYHPSMMARRWLAVRLEFLGSTIIFSAALLSILAIASGRLSSGLVGLTMSYALQITSSLGGIIRTTVEVEMSTVSVERVLEYCKLPSEAPDIIANHRPLTNWPISGQVELHDYSTRYRPGLDLVLKGINLIINPREKIGIVGRTGAGKSSLTLALFRMIEPVNGFISIDNVNTSTIGLRDLRERLAIIPQDSQAFEGTVRENLDPGNRYSDDQLWHVLELSHLKNHIANMDGQLLAHVKESGSNFSVGQRQLMSLARALLTSSMILVLDEATAAVDVETDQIIQETIRKEFKDRTIITIAHRLNTIIDSDRIVVLAAGKVVEFDSPQTLLSDKNSMFYALCNQGGLADD
ncbi:P-loop containing nucleoside triphosphate hydrolase protein [Lipomyces japonicus]|uniref:P-loop containing nucleoside triphosphate hydrolase protein n=1 Tax=Lipomyces japonicus TaxID=56871 RepID=UPI0034CE43CB